MRNHKGVYLKICDALVGGYQTYPISKIAFVKNP